MGPLVTIHILLETLAITLAELFLVLPPPCGDTPVQACGLSQQPLECFIFPIAFHGISLWTVTFLHFSLGSETLFLTVSKWLKEVIQTVKEQVRVVLKELEEVIENEARDMSDITGKLTESTTKYRDVVTWPVVQQA